MANLYGVLKVVHVLSVVVWIGGAAALGALVAWLARSRDRATLTAFLPLAGRYGQTMAGPSSILVLLSGVGMMIAGKVGMALWTGWGLAGILVHFIYGATIMRKRMTAFASLLSEPATDGTRIADAGANLRRANLFYLLIMTSVIVVMVLKPTV
jgi:uncharacterized membrane protein